MFAAEPATPFPLRTTTEVFLGLGAPTFCTRRAEADLLGRLLGRLDVRGLELLDGGLDVRRIGASGRSCPVSPAIFTWTKLPDGRPYAKSPYDLSVPMSAPFPPAWPIWTFSRIAATIFVIAAGFHFEFTACFSALTKCCCRASR